jgi:hypothetical protein
VIFEKGASVTGDVTVADGYVWINGGDTLRCGTFTTNNSLDSIARSGTGTAYILMTGYSSAADVKWDVTTLARRWLSYAGGTPTVTPTTGRAGDTIHIKTATGFTPTSDSVRIGSGAKIGAIYRAADSVDVVIPSGATTGALVLYNGFAGDSLAAGTVTVTRKKGFGKFGFDFGFGF